MDDETLARMLQDELFSDELARNPDFAHLARGSAGPSRSSARLPPGQRRSGAPPPNPFEGVNVMDKLSGTYQLLAFPLRMLHSYNMIEGFQFKSNHHKFITI
jgi:hypothetical protein